MPKRILTGKVVKKSGDKTISVLVTRQTTHPFYKKIGFKRGDFPISEHYYNTALSLPIFPNLEEKDQIKVVEIIKRNLL